MSGTPGARGRVRGALRLLTSPRGRLGWPLIGGALAGAISQDLLVVSAVALIIVAWLALVDGEGPPVLALAFTFQWLQVTSAVVYAAFTGRRVHDMTTCDWRPMVWIGLGALCALLAGIVLGRWLLRRRPVRFDVAQRAFTWRVLVGGYLLTTMATTGLQELAFSMPGLTQAIFAFSYIRLALLLLIFRRLVRPRIRWSWLVGLLLAETLLGSTGYFAGFKDSMMMAALALLEIFEARRIAHWAAVLGVALFMVLVGTIWTGVKAEYRRNWKSEQFAGSETRRLERLDELTSQWAASSEEAVLRDLDQLVQRLWAVPYPAMALKRVPAALPHERGRLLLEAVEHVLTPRLLFPEKRELRSDSLTVRKYAGIWVAGPRQGTSIAFGYVGESYVDFGVPLMFVPIFGFGLLIGLAYRLFLTTLRHGEIAVAAVSAIFWLSLYLFEKSWIKTLGDMGNYVIFLGGVALLLDRLLPRGRAAEAGPPGRVARLGLR